MARSAHGPKHLQLLVLVEQTSCRFWDLVTAGIVRDEKDPTDPYMAYASTLYDTWLIVDGRVDEHWDSALKP